MIVFYILLTSVLTAAAVVLLQKLFNLRRKTIVLMRENEIDENALKKARLSIGELMSAARQAGYFNLGDIDTAIL